MSSLQTTRSFSARLLEGGGTKHLRPFQTILGRMQGRSLFDQCFHEDDGSGKSQCFRYFSGQKLYLNEEDFLLLNAALFNGGVGNEEATSFSKKSFARFDRNRDQKIDETEFESVWNDWLKPLLKPVSALVIVDVQNDFISGSLALKNCPANQEGSEVVPVINDLIENAGFDVVAYTFDHHPENHISFIDNVGSYKLSEDSPKKEGIAVFDTVIFEGPPKTVQKLWPRHCVKGTWGAQLHEDVILTDSPVLIYKGMNPHIDSYSAFFDNLKASKTKLHDELRRRQVTHVFVCGLALDVCVSYTALDASEMNYATVLVRDASRGTNTDNISAMEAKLRSQSIVIATSEEVTDLVKGKSIPLEFARLFAEKNKATLGTM